MPACSIGLSRFIMSCCNTNHSPNTSCNYSINEIPLFNVYQRPFQCPSQFNLFFFKEPPLFSFKRCHKHRVFQPMEDICNPSQAQQEFVRVGDCPRCFQELRFEVRPQYQQKIRTIQGQMRDGSQSTRKTLQSIEQQNRQLQRKMMELYNSYESEVRKAVREFQEEEMKCFQRLRKKKDK